MTEKKAEGRKPRGRTRQPRSKAPIKSPELDCRTDWLDMPDVDLTEYEGFVYLVTNTRTGRKYVGRKYLWARLKVKQKGKKRRKHVVKGADWQTYKSSCRQILEEIAENGIGDFEFRILKLCKTRKETNFLEVQEQFDRRVLEAKLPNGEWEYYNGNIMSRYFKPTEEGEKYESKCKAISEALKSGYADGTIVHGLKGKPHPNRGKKLPQTGHKKMVGARCYTNGMRNIRAKEGQQPEGFWRGATRRNESAYVQSARKQLAYAANPRHCAVCNKQHEYVKRHLIVCSKECKSARQSQRMMGRYLGKLNPVAKYIYVTPVGQFDVSHHACKLLGVTDVTVRNRCRAGWPGYKLIERGKDK
jgi:hypothetical protein